MEEDHPMAQNTAEKRHREDESDSPPETQQKRFRQTIESSDEEDSEEAFEEDPEEDSDEEEGLQEETSAESGEEPSSDEDYWNSKSKSKPKPKPKPKPKTGGRKTKPQKSTKPKLNPKPRPNLKRNQRGKQLTAVRVDRSSSESNSGEENDNQEELDIPDQKSNFQPDIQYNEYWTEGKERRLRKDWSPDDDFIIEKSYADEIALWRKTTNIFKCAPPDLIEADVGVQPGGTITNQQTGTKWRKNPNWSQKFCMAMSAIICLPFWKGKPECLRYVLRKALHLRVGAGDEKRRAPSMPSEDNIYLNTTLDRIQEQVLEEGIVEEDNLHHLRTLRTIIQSEIGLGMTPEHWSFHKYLKKVVKPGERVTDNDDSCKLQVCDLDNIQNAWKLYTDTKKLQLSTMEQYRDNFNTLNSNRGFGSLGNTQARQDNFKSWKKEWMLKVRRDAQIRENARLHENRRQASEEQQVDDEMQFDDGFANGNLTPPPAQDRPSLNQDGRPSFPIGSSRNRNSSRMRRSPSASSQNNAADEVAGGSAGLQIDNDFPPLGSQPGSYIGVARKGAELPVPEDAMKAHWKMVDENIRADQRRMGAFQTRKMEAKQAAIARRVPNPMETQMRLDANLLLVDPRPEGHSTYMIELGNSPAIKEALLGRRKSLYSVEKSLGVRITWDHRGQSLYVFPEAYRGDPLLLEQAHVVKRKLEFAYGALKFWRWRLVSDEKAANKPEFKECCDLWLDADSVIVADYFERELNRADDRFAAPKAESPSAQKPKDDGIDTVAL
jgi:hypothetical protein